MMRLRRAERLTVDSKVVQVRRIEGLSELPDRRALARIVHDNATAFFLRVSTNLRVTRPVVASDGTVWAAAYDGNAVDEILSTARARGTRVSRIAPHADLVPPLLRARKWFMWREPLAWYPAREWQPSRGAGNALLIVALLWLVASVTAAVSASTLRQKLFVRDHQPQLAATRISSAAIARTRAELGRVSKQLGDVAAFGDTRPAIASLIGEISSVLPESSAVVTLRIDAAEGSLTIITSNVAELLEELARVHGISGVRVVGALTSEMVGGARFQRVTVRFRRGAPRT